MSAPVELAWFRDPLDPALAALAGSDNPPAPRRGPRIGRPGKVVTPLRGPVVDGVSVAVSLDPCLSLKALAGYSGLSVRNLRDRLTDPAHPLPHYRIGGKIVVRRSDYDAWVARYRRVGNPDLDRMVAEALRDVRSAPKPRRAAKVA